MGLEGPSAIALAASANPSFFANCMAVKPARFLKSASAPAFNNALTAPA